MTDLDEHAEPNAHEGVTRRGVLGGAAALAGSGLLVGPAGVAVADRPRSATPRSGDTGRRPRLAPPLSLTHAQVLDPATGRVTPDATIVFRRGVVWSVGRGLPRGQVIDVGGAFVIPGLLDGHVHTSTIAAGQRALAGGATTVRSATTSFYEDVGLRAVAQYGAIRLPRMLAAGLFVTPQLGDSVLADPRLAPLTGLPEGVRSPEALRYLVEVNIARGVDQIKTRGTERAGVPEQDPRVQVYDERQLRAVVEAAARHGRYVMCHAHGDEGGRAAVAAGVRSIEHGTFLERPTLELMVRRGTFLVPTFSAVVDLAEPGGEYTDPRLVERGRQMLPVLRQVTATAYAMGIPIVAGTDTSYTEQTLSTMAGEMRYVAAAGLSNLDALRAGTTTAARLFRRQRTLGRLLPGYAADAVVIGGDPLANLTALDDIRMVIAAGWIARNELTSAG
jgi:imidazolonepropionase-like amidohydrolase